MQMCNCRKVQTMKNNDKFNLNSFLAPDASFAPVYIWVWNDVCSREIIDDQLAEMQALGIRAFYILPEPKEFRPDSMPTSLSPAYLSDAFFALCAYAIDKATALGMRCWIYDEGGWPSGSACGRVVLDHPEYSAGGRYPDLLNKAATEYFIEITHKQYAAATRNFSAVFTDEPKAPMRPFNKELTDKYEQIYGESVLPYLALLQADEEPTEKNMHILQRWYDLCSRMFCENYLLPCKKWAHDNGVAFTGHLDKDHRPDGCMNGGGNFNLMRALRCFDIPGIDVIWRQLYLESRVSVRDEMNAYNGFYPRYASSAAAQNGTKLAMSEVFGVAGPGLTYDMMRYTIGYQAVRGINIFNPFNFPLGRKGQLLAQELPIFTRNQPYYRNLAQFNRYAERLSYISSLGERVYETALYYPVADFQRRCNAAAVAAEFDNLGRRLEEKMVDFDIVDDDVLQAAATDRFGCMHMGIASYKHLIIPENAFIPAGSQKAITAFVDKGGKVSVNLDAVAAVVEADGEGLRAMRRKAENAEILILFNESQENNAFCVQLPAEDGCLLDLMNGKLTRFKAKNGKLQLTLATGETAVVLLSEEILAAEDEKRLAEQVRLTDGFVLRKETELVCNDNGFCNIKHTDRAVSAALGDWVCYIGAAYSGSCVYEVSFTLPDEKVGKAGKISLGDVQFAAEVRLNDKYLGAVLMPAYSLEIPCGLLQHENKLQITVTNTSANWYVHTDYFDKWTKNELSSYFDTELSYAKDSAAGGLYGPVVIYTE